MNRALVGAVLTALIALGVASSADADRAPTAQERLAIARVFKLPAGCALIRVSSVSSRFAAFHGSHTNSKRCKQYAANGIALLHKTAHRWRVISDGSDVTCPIPGAPTSVLLDLRPCYGWKLLRDRAAAAALAEAQRLAPMMYDPPPTPSIASCRRQGPAFYECDVDFDSPSPDVVCGEFTFAVSTNDHDETVVTEPERPSCSPS